MREDKGGRNLRSAGSVTAGGALDRWRFSTALYRRTRTSAFRLGRGCARFALLAALLAGCRTRPHPNTAHVPDWQSEDFAPPPAPVAPVAPVPTPAPAAAAPQALPRTNEVVETWVPLDRWCQARGVPAPLQTAVVPLATWALSTSNGILVVHAGSQVAQWDGVELRLGFAPQLIHGQPCVHTLDLHKTVEPLLVGTTLDGLATNPVIVIDPGHGGEDSGARSVWGGRCEKEFTLDWARRLGPLLARDGWQVLLTRANDANLSLSNRVAFADEHKAALFLSLHFNSAGPEARQAGLETYCLAPAGTPATVTRGFGDDPSLVFPNNTFDAANLQMACRLHRALLGVNGHHDRGVRRARFLGVLRAQNRPAVLIEGGYLSNPHEARLIGSPEYRQRLAEAVAEGLKRSRLVVCNR